MPRGIKRGKAFEYEFARGLREFASRNPSFFWRRWPDHRDWVRINKKLRAPKAPADFVAVHDGAFYALELKSSRARRYLCSWVKDHQKDTLLNIKMAGGRGYVVLNRRKPTMGCWAVDIENFLWLEVKSRGDGYKSISWEDIEAHGIKIPRVSGAWDLTPLFEG